MEIERLISYFDIKTEEFVGEYNIDNLDFNFLKSIMNPKDDDPLMYGSYILNIDQAKKLAPFVNLGFNFNDYIYQIDCFQK